MILGVTGALGGRLALEFADRFDVVSPRPRRGSVADPLLPNVRWLESPFDACELGSIGPLLDEAAPDAIVNCVAVTPKHAQAASRTVMEQVNSDFPLRLANDATRRGAYLVHISTDAVFSGGRGGYTEWDRPYPSDAYGRTKLRGEASAPGVATLRTTFYGSTPSASTLLDWFVQQRGRQVNAYTNYRFSGLWLGELADAVAALVVRPVRLSGLFHVGGESVSKHRLLQTVNERLGLGVDVRAAPEPVCDRSLDSSKFWTLIGRSTPGFEAMVDSMLPELDASLGRSRAAA